jgi:hypothetical protein
MAKKITAKELHRVLVEIGDAKDQFDRVYVFILDLEKQLERLLNEAERSRSESPYPPYLHP